MSLFPSFPSSHPELSGPVMCFRQQERAFFARPHSSVLPPILPRAHLVDKYVELAAPKDSASLHNEDGHSGTSLSPHPRQTASPLVINPPNSTALDARTQQSVVPITTRFVSGTPAPALRSVSCSQASVEVQLELPAGTCIPRGRRMCMTIHRWRLGGTSDHQLGNSPVQFVSAQRRAGKHTKRIRVK